MKRLHLLIVGFVVLGAIAAYFFWDEFQPESSPILIEDEAAFEAFRAAVDHEEALTGEIYLTSIEKREGYEEPIDEQGFTFPQGMFRFDVESQTVAAGSVPYMRHPNRAADGRMIYVTEPNVLDPFYNPVLHIQSVDGTVTANPVTEYEAGADAPTVVERRLPQWSPDGERFAYNAQVQEVGAEIPSVRDVRSWKIFVGVPGEEDVEYFADGYAPHWINGGSHIVYVKADGVYIKEFSAGADQSAVPETLIVKESPEYRIYNQIDVFPNGNFVAVAHPSESGTNSYIDIYRIGFEGGEAQKGEQVFRYELQPSLWGIWPLFSPGGRYLSYQTRDLLVEANAGTTIDVVDLLTGKLVRELRIDNFYFDYAFNTDWVRN